MKFTKKIFLLIMFLFLGLVSSKETFSKEKKSKPDYSYLTEKVSIYSDMNKKENIGYLIKGTRVNVFETKEVTKKIKNKQGKEIDATIIMKKITYKDVNKTKVAWIEDGYLVSTLNEAVDEKFKNLDFTEDFKSNIKVLLL